MTFDLPGLRLQSENWWRRSHPGWLLQKQRDGEKNAVRLIWLSVQASRFTWEPPFLVTLTRLSPSAKGLDGDGLQGACKYVRDEICRQLGVDDGDSSLVRFVYRQERGPYGARVRVEEAGRAAAEVTP